MSVSCRRSVGETGGELDALFRVGVGLCCLGCSVIGLGGVTTVALSLISRCYDYRM
ncbi:uncharacterized protein BDW47DRAFT_105191 [Aspergillus candidus]|uniref:Transmembrane protein n=1 Tax=Aspergillus candidus TaxID=41067 RepID=A0A2I2FCI9_ASPCN|nr:hypothetical protein BDW47DRAFT_105191 [Aspergillus candidus]PLB38317.1 hypothetical protein BDW47DRAFT_105191 [Aspergillus candidus]